MGICSEALDRYLNLKWVEMIAALFLWAVAIILYGYLEKKKIANAKRKQERKAGTTGVRVKKTVPELRRSVLFFALFVLILASCLWSYLSDLIPAAKDSYGENFVEYEGMLSYDEYLGGLFSFAGYTDASGNVQRLEVPYFLRAELKELAGERGVFRGCLVFGESSRVVVSVAAK